MAARLPFSIMAKPIGPICNLNCEYCYYLSQEERYPHREDFRMAERTLTEYLRQFIAASPGPQVDFAWQGGEPTLMGLDFFRNVVALQAALLPPGWTCTNSIQTNGTLLDDEWCRFFRDQGFLVGISLDGPGDLHDRYRVDKGGRPTHDKVLRGLRLLQTHGVEHNVLCLVSQSNASHPLEVYRYFKALGITWLQFIPLVEHVGQGAVTERTVDAKAYGNFMVRIFDEWVRHDVGRIFIQIFEECLSVWAGRGANLCIHQETCGRGLALEHNGDVYACDHFVAPEYRRGNLHTIPLGEIAIVPEQVDFGLAKRDGLPEFCRQCEVRFMCNGGCPKDRVIRTPGGEPGLNYLCAGYRPFFRHVAPFMRRMADLWHRGLNPASITAEVRAADVAQYQRRQAVR